MLPLLRSPHAKPVKLLPVVTAVKGGSGTVASPERLRPQQATSPSVRAAHAEVEERESVMAMVSKLPLGGRLMSSLWLQHATVPFVRRPHDWSPLATMVLKSPPGGSGLPNL